MRDYWLVQEILKASGFLFIGLSLLGIGLALWLPKKRAGKALALAAVTALIAIPMSQVVRGVMEAKEIEARSDKAKAMWQERCKTAGEKIHKTVENVDGIYLMKIRPEGKNFSDQFKLDDPYGSDLGGEGYIESFLRGRNRYVTSGQSIQMKLNGYTYVEAQDQKDGKRYRYTGSIEEPWQTNKAYSQGYKKFVLHRAPATGEPLRYGVTYDDISTQIEREYWVAGSSLKVVDLQTNEVIAERIGYMVDLAQGSRAGQRSPWLFAAYNICPEYPEGKGASSQSFQTTSFVEKVLKTTK